MEFDGIVAADRIFIHAQLQFRGNAARLRGCIDRSVRDRSELVETAVKQQTVFAAENQQRQTRAPERKDVGTLFQLGDRFAAGFFGLIGVPPLLPVVVVPVPVAIGRPVSRLVKISSKP